MQKQHGTESLVGLLGFSYSPILGGGVEDVTRRDPSPVIKVRDTYYVWYSRTKESRGGYTATIWYATSKDGWQWEEQGEALGKGTKDSFDEHAVFTPSILVAGNSFYLSYTAVPEPFSNEGASITPTAIGMAKAENPDGPWQRISGNPILTISANHDDFDSLRVDDSCFVVREGKYWMYYKGRQWERSPKETKMGVAIADQPKGPYIKHPENPVVDGGHEVCVWPEGAGVAGLFCNVGPAGNTLQYAEDGIHFNKVSDIVPPMAPGPFRKDNFISGNGPGISWGVAMESRCKCRPYLVRFECE